MKKKFSVLVAVPALILAFSAQAHDEKEHMKTAESPDCAAMSGMDHSKMDMNDPVVMAMMTQCMSTVEHGEEESDAASHAHSHSDHMTGAGKAGESSQ
ncbi:hypothetical protein [Neptunomonas japonica]|uniref:hypothetical protein n=1 Tax=Neptunomonas japonica TaxID=417574 RepID=UPI00040A886B|nr:hypothetical protein [Neptunomonas japonica]